jgi:hypothetical protein
MEENSFRSRDISSQSQTVMPGTLGESSNRRDFPSNLYQQRSDVPPPADPLMHYFEPTARNTNENFASLYSIIEQRTRPANERIPISDTQPPIYELSQPEESFSSTFYYDYDRYNESLNKLKVLEQQKLTLRRLLQENTDEHGRTLDQRMDLRERKISYEAYGLQLDIIDNDILSKQNNIIQLKELLKQHPIPHPFSRSYIIRTINDNKTMIQQLEVQRANLATAWKNLQNRDSTNGRYTIHGNFAEALGKIYKEQQAEQQALQNKEQNLYSEYQQLHAEISKIDEKIQQLFPEQTF